jgi:hypothetical protein
MTQKAQAPSENPGVLPKAAGRAQWKTGKEAEALEANCDTDRTGRLKNTLRGNSEKYKH